MDGPLEYDLNKSWKKSLINGILGAAMASTPISEEPPVTKESPAIKIPNNAKITKWNHTNLHEELHPIAALESNNGKNVNHTPNSKGEYHTAVGPLGLKPVTAHEHYLKDPYLKSQYNGLEDRFAFTDKLTSDPIFYNTVASRIWKTSSLKFKDVAKTVYSWRWGRKAAIDATQEQVDNDPYVRKYMKIAPSIQKSENAEENQHVLYVSWGAEGIDKLAAMYSKNDEPQNIKLLQNKLDTANGLWDSFVLQHEGHVLNTGSFGDVGRFTVQIHDFSELKLVKDQAEDALKHRITIGIGKKTGEADQALAHGSTMSPGKITFFTKQIGSELASTLELPMGKTEESLIKIEGIVVEEDLVKMAISKDIADPPVYNYMNSPKERLSKFLFEHMPSKVGQAGLIYDYTHLLPKDTPNRDKLRLYVLPDATQENRANPSKPRIIWGAKLFHTDHSLKSDQPQILHVLEDTPLPPAHTMSILLASHNRKFPNIEQYEGKGLGALAYTALMHHGWKYRQKIYMSGGEHSTMAMKTHLKIQKLHQTNYEPVPNVPINEYRNMDEWNKAPNEPYDAKYAPYKYKIDPGAPTPRDAKVKKTEEALEKRIVHWQHRNPGAYEGANAGFKGPAGPQMANPKLAEPLSPDTTQGNVSKSPDELIGSLQELSKPKAEQSGKTTKDPEAVRGKIASLLEDMQSHAKDIERMKESDPEAYKTVIELINGIVNLGKTLPSKVNKSENDIIEQAAFLHKKSGVVYGVGIHHDITKLPTEYSDSEYEDGFLTKDNEYLSRSDASVLLNKENIQSQDIFNKTEEALEEELQKKIRTSANLGIIVPVGSVHGLGANTVGANAQGKGTGLGTVKGDGGKYIKKKVLKLDANGKPIGTTWVNVGSGMQQSPDGAYTANAKTGGILTPKPPQNPNG
jgi:hypothetical protein